jgi:hypothetical protein
MSWWQIWRKDHSASAQPAEPTNGVPAGGRTIQAAAELSPASGDVSAAERRLTILQRRRQDALFDVEQGELAETEENPWTERIALLSETLAAIENDRRALDARPTVPSLSLPPVPIEHVVAHDEEFIEVRFSIGSEAFRYGEQTDWDERGGPTVRGDLRRQAGDPAALVPGDVPAELRDPLIAHLDGSLDVFATDLRDRALAGNSLPEQATLADLARPCPDCGGWQDWHGRCPECARHDLRRQALRDEAERLERERTATTEERHRLIERLPIARRRLVAVESEIASLGR